MPKLLDFMVHILIVQTMSAFRLAILLPMITLLQQKKQALGRIAHLRSLPTETQQQLLSLIQ
jgi:hypothetical protein